MTGFVDKGHICPVSENVSIMQIDKYLYLFHFKEQIMWVFEKYLDLQYVT